MSSFIKHWLSRSRFGPQALAAMLICCLAFAPAMSHAQTPAAPPDQKAAPAAPDQKATPPATGTAPAAAAPATGAAPATSTAPAAAAPAAPAADAPPPLATPDPTGSNTGNIDSLINAGAGTVTADDIKALKADPDKPATHAQLVKAFDTIGQTAVSMNILWTLLTGFLVMFMQAGFAMVEVGFCQSKNAAHIVMTNLMIYPLGMLGFWIAGFALMFGSLGGVSTMGGANLLPAASEFSIAGFGLFGKTGFFLGSGVYDVSIYTMFLFQMVFMDTTATIPTGAMAERWRFSAFVVYGFFVSIIAYPIYGHMMWGNGGLATLGTLHNLGHGAVDFAGSSVVHAVGGFISLAGVVVIGARKGKFNADGKPNAIPGHNIPMATIGAFILAFGWFGFNPGSALAIFGGNMRVGIVATNTMLASAGGAFAACLWMKFTTKKWDPGMMINGLLAGLVAITAPCAFVDATSSVIIGAIAGIICIQSVYFIERVLKLDDPVGAISVHGVCGIWGLISVGIFADGTFGQGFNSTGADKYLGTSGAKLLGVTGILHGDSGQLIAQLIAAVVCMVWSFGSAYIFFKVQNMFMRIRSKPEDEIEGLDGPEMGTLGYYPSPT